MLTKLLTFIHYRFHIKTQIVHMDQSVFISLTTNNTSAMANMNKFRLDLNSESLFGEDDDEQDDDDGCQCLHTSPNAYLYYLTYENCIRVDFM